MPAKLESMKVRLNNDQKWEMKQGNGPWKLPPDYPQLEVGTGEVGVFTYEIIGSGGVQFDPVNPFVEKANANPQQPDFKDQFIVLGKGTKELTVIDVNGKAGSNNYSGGSYEYELRFTENAPPLDPIIKNLGCCKAVALTGAEAAAYSLAIAAAGALAALGLRKLRARTSPAAASGVAGKDQQGR